MDEQKHESSSVSLEKGQVAPSCVPTGNRDNEQNLIEGMPAIREWQPAPMFSVLGTFVGFFFWISLAYILRPIGAWIAQTIVVAIYGLVIYRSYFTDKPLITSSKAISFLNYAVTAASTVVSVAFGRCMNANLKTSHETRIPRKGISYIVAIIYFVATIGVMFLYESNRYSQSVSSPTDVISNQSTSHENVGSSSISSSQQDPSVITDPVAGVSFRIPDGWHEEDLNKQRDYIRWKARPDETGLVWMVYGASLADGIEMDDLSADDIAGSVSYYLHDCTDETVERVTIGSCDYWKISGSGHLEQDGQTAAMSMTEFMTIHNGKAYTFIYYDGQLDSRNDSYYEDFEGLIGSASFV